MGLAASQARFLGITARKSNIEYEGQQVNQQRTALAEEVNSLYSKLLALEVPVAPDTTQYYETNYSFSISDKSNGLDGEYIIKTYYMNDDGETYNITAERTYEKNVAEQSNLTSQWQIKQATDGSGAYSLYDSKNDKNYPLTLSTNPDIIKLINETEGVTPIKDGDSLYTYNDADGQPHYIPASQVEAYVQEPCDLTSYLKTNKAVTEPKYFENVVIKLDENGRMEKISLKDYTGLDVDTTRSYDTEGYDAALRDYTMSKDEYDKMVADLNAKTESLQQEDKVLELRLNQIDTEQNELQTELEAVKAILDKNIENTFNTFS